MATGQEIQKTTGVSLVKKIGARYGVEGDKLMTCLKETAFKNATNEQMMALLIVADQYQLNPFTKEIYAFPDKVGGIVPVVGVDGWTRIINNHPQYDGMEFEQDAESCTCRIYRKDRAHATEATEYLEECRRKTQPWESHPRRMLRHKAMIQAARMAFGYSGIKDPDEAERIIEATVTERPAIAMPVPRPVKVIEQDVTPEPQQEAPDTKDEPAAQVAETPRGMNFDLIDKLEKHKQYRVKTFKRAVEAHGRTYEDWPTADRETLEKILADCEAKP